MTKIQRVIKVCKWLIFSDIAENNTDLAKILGYSISSFSQILNEKVPLSEKFLDKLIILDSNINKSWIMDGTGKMLISEEKNIQNNKRIEEIEALSEEDQKHIYTILDTLIRDAKARKSEK